MEWDRNPRFVWVTLIGRPINGVHDIVKHRADGSGWLLDAFKAGPWV
jgi:hypothetical protein